MNLFQYIEFKQSDRLNGGVADKASIHDFDKFWLDVGATIEKEHTKSGRNALEIASDHLKEDKMYYKKLLEYVEHDKIAQIFKNKPELAKKLKDVFNPPDHHND
jgi:hypothetical protein